MTAAKLDCITEVERILQVEHESGHCLEFNESWTGFKAVCAAIEEQISGVEPNWLEAWSKASTEEIITVWIREDYPS